MKDLLLLSFLFAYLAFGFYIMDRLDAFLEENQRRIMMENRGIECRRRESDPGEEAGKSLGR